MTAEPKTMKEWALYYADLGFAVFPLLPKTKKPAVTSGFKAATTNKELIEKWWNKNQNFNIGCATGSRSDGLVVLDFDEDEEKGKHGYDVLKDWQKKHGNLPETCQSITGRGGYHFLYRDKTATHSSKNGLYEGVDIKAEGGYIVLPPSVHPNGNIYEWEQEPEEFGITQVDAAVKHFLKGDNQQPEGEYKPPFEMPEIIPDGERVSTLVSLIASLCSSNNRRNMSIEAIKAAVRAENETRCVPALPEDELEKSVFPAIKRFLSKQQEEDECIGKGWEEHQTGKAVCDNGKSRQSKPLNFNLEKACDVEAKEAEWLIPGYVPKYGITTIAGEGGVGKTSVWCSLVASFTTGNHSFLIGDLIPFEVNDPPLNVLVLSAEDSWTYVLKTRLEANGADLNRVWFLSPEDERFTDLNFDGDLLKGIIEQNKPDVIVFDPLQAFVPSNLKMGDRNAMRKCFAPLIGYGEQYKVTSIIIAHANKQSGVWGRKRIADSSDIWDASRSVLMAGITEDNNVRYISQEKSNYGCLSDTVLYTLDECVPVFQCHSTKRDRDFVQAEVREKNIRPAMEEAKEFILDTLEEQKQMEVSELDGLAKANGISDNALKNAKSSLKKEGLTKTWGIGYGKEKKYYISLKDTGKPNE